MFTTVFRDPTFERLTREMDRMIRAGAPGTSPRVPGVNLWRTGEGFVLEAELPGFGLDELEILASDEGVTLRGHRPTEAPEGATPMRIERTLTSFERTIALPAPIDSDAVSAEFTLGVLRVTLPLAVESRPKRISISAPGKVTDGEASENDND